MRVLGDCEQAASWPPNLQKRHGFRFSFGYDVVRGAIFVIISTLWYCFGMTESFGLPPAVPRFPDGEFDRETWRQELARDCFGEASFALMDLIVRDPDRAGVYPIVEAHTYLALAGNDPYLARSIAETLKRNETLARIALRTDDEALATEAIEGAMAHYASGDSTSLENVAAILGRADVLGPIDESWKRDPQIVQIAFANGDHTLIAGLEDSQYVVDGFLAAMADEKSPARAFMGEAADGIRSISDDDPVLKAERIERFIEVTGDMGLIQDLYETALRFEDPIESAPYLARVAVATDNRALALELKALIETQPKISLPRSQWDVYDTTARRVALYLQDYDLAGRVIDHDSKEQLLRSIMVSLRDVDRAWAEDYQALRDIAIETEDVGLANQMVNSSASIRKDYTDVRYPKEHGEAAILRIARNQNSPAVIMTLGPSGVRNRLLKEFFVYCDDLDLAEQITDTAARNEAIATIAQNRLDPVLAAAQDLPSSMVERVTQSWREAVRARSIKVPLSAVASVQDMRERGKWYWSFVHAKSNIATIGPLLADCIRATEEPGNRWSQLIRLGEATKEVSYVYEGLAELHGTIDGLPKIQSVTDALRMINAA